MHCVLSARLLRAGRHGRLGRCSVSSSRYFEIASSSGCQRQIDQNDQIAWRHLETTIRFTADISTGTIDDLGRFSCFEITCYEIATSVWSALCSCSGAKFCDAAATSWLHKMELTFYILGCSWLFCTDGTPFSLGERRERSGWAACNILNMNHYEL